MSQPDSPLHKLVHGRFREVFGPPDNALGRDDHWAFRPTPMGIAINVLVNGTAEQPAVWVFDPHTKDDGIERVSVNDEKSLNDIIKRIQDRVERAKANYRSSSP